MTKYWLVVVQRAHVLRGVGLGIVQSNHGAKAGVSRMSPGDRLVYYSPKTDYPVGEPLREFTAIGRVDEGEVYQAEDGDFHPYRRHASYDPDAMAVPIAPLLEVLELTRETPNWGFVMRRGLVEISASDFRVIADRMGSA